MTQNYINADTVKLTEILKLDDSIRFVGKIKNRKLQSFVRRENKIPLLNEELDNMAHYQASVKANMENMFDSTLGKTNWMITSKEKVKLITLFLDDGLLIFSTESDANHDEIITKIQSLNLNFN
ncbi:MAG TPA: hypothetical protein VFG24_01715 [Nitrosopumilaceae archaeon]|nr:hypothetical protein [Nitrosopumilaceae archaeon]